MQSYSFLTADTIISTAKAEAIGSTTSSLTALQDEQLLAKVHQINAKFVNSAHSNHPKGGWSWMKKITSFTTKVATSLNGAISAGTGSIVLADSSTYGSIGRIIIENSAGAFDFVDYTANAANTLTVSSATGVETVSANHSTGERVESLVPLPTDYSKANIVYINSSEYDYEQCEGFPNGGGYTTYGGYLLLPRGIGAQTGTLIYYARGSSITALTDTTNIPSEFSRYAIEELKAHIYMVRRKREDIQFSLQLAEQDLQYAFSQDSQPISNSERSRIPLPY